MAVIVHREIASDMQHVTDDGPCWCEPFTINDEGDCPECGHLLANHVYAHGEIVGVGEQHVFACTSWIGSIFCGCKYERIEGVQDLTSYEA